LRANALCGDPLEFVDVEDLVTLCKLGFLVPKPAAASVMKEILVGLVLLIKVKVEAACVPGRARDVIEDSLDKVGIQSGVLAVDRLHDDGRAVKLPEKKLTPAARVERKKEGKKERK